MKRLFLTVALVGVVPVAFAQAVPMDSAGEDKPATTAAMADEAKAPLSESRCLRQTGSAIVAKQNAKGRKQCNGLPGRAYTREDLNRTGQVNIADALRSLDPIVY